MEAVDCESKYCFFKDCSRQGANLGSFGFNLFSSTSSALAHTATPPAPPPKKKLRLTAPWFLGLINNVQDVAITPFTMIMQKTIRVRFREALARQKFGLISAQKLQLWIDVTPVRQVTTVKVKLASDFDFDNKLLKMTEQSN